MVIVYDRRGHLGITLMAIGVICISIAIVKEFKVIFNIDLITSVLLGLLGFGLATLGYCIAVLRIPPRTLYLVILGIIGFSSLVFGFFLMIEGQILGDRTIPAAVASIIMGITCILIAGGAKAKRAQLASLENDGPRLLVKISSKGQRFLDAYEGLVRLTETIS